MQHTDNFKLGLLHFVHLLVTVDGHIDDRERAAILEIKEEEQIPDKMFHDFEAKAETANEQQIYFDGNELLSACSDDERLAAFVHLYKLAEADATISNKEVRFLLYGLKANKVSFEDVVLTANMSGK
ncbi:MAG: TerB family tellurite resistance protein [Bacteroidetes bacterium]|nr:TerB family tellurite resistance protein [Bacteroidota bacterium]